jgi:hypothetical protein
MTQIRGEGKYMTQVVVRNLQVLRKLTTKLIKYNSFNEGRQNLKIRT